MFVERPIAKVVDVSIDKTMSGLYVASSDALPGLHISSRDLDAIREDLPNVIRALYAHQGLSVFAAELEDGEDHGVPKQWVTMPAYVADQALSA